MSKIIIPDFVLEQIPAITAMNTPLRRAHFLSQCSHESAGFTAVRENLNYSAARLLQIFGKHFTHEDSQFCAGRPELIANICYANRMGNGNAASGDGFKYRGRGYIQITGRDKYAAFGKFIGEDCLDDPDIIARKYPLLSAAWYFDVNRLWAICDKGAGDDVIRLLTRRINGGLNGLEDRIRLFREFYR